MSISFFTTDDDGRTDDSSRATGDGRRDANARTKANASENDAVRWNARDDGWVCVVKRKAFISCAQWEGW
jgi:hypothetical protein